MAILHGKQGLLCDKYIFLAVGYTGEITHLLILGTEIKGNLFNNVVNKLVSLTHSHTMTPFDDPGKQAF